MPPELEQMTWQVEMDDQLAAKVAEKEAQGWDQVPGVKPIITYQLVRVKPTAESPQGSALGILKINDGLISVVKAADQPK